MSDQFKPYHPVPKDERAQHYPIPESIENERPLGADEPDQSPPSSTDAPGPSHRDRSDWRYGVEQAVR